MTEGRRVRLSAEQRTEIWRRWKAGESLREIGRAFGKKVRSALETSLAPLELPSKTLEIFKNKVRNLNSRSQHSTSKDLMDELGLVLSSREKRAHDARHESAHGKDDEVDIEWIRDLKLLRVLFHRILIAMTQADDEYYDYFTLGNPIRKVKKPVPGQ
ncbi:helix-turn-helix domain-containing protein [Tunturiibacter gelidiferens]